MEARVYGVTLDVGIHRLPVGVGVMRGGEGAMYG